MLQLAENPNAETDATFAFGTMPARGVQHFLRLRSLTADDPTVAILHDLRNPLAAICGCAELLAAGKLDLEQTRRVAANVWRASQRMKSLLGDFVSEEKGRGERREFTNLRAVISASCEAAGVNERSDIALTMDVPQELNLQMDRGGMERVFLNLIVNALEAMPSGGAIYIAASATGDQVRITVEDTGPGIPATIGGRLFEPFATAGKPDGIGLGLAISRAMVRRHGGDLWVEAARDTRFVMCLPQFGITSGQKERK